MNFFQSIVHSRIDLDEIEARLESPDQLERLKAAREFMRFVLELLDVRLPPLQ